MLGGSENQRMIALDGKTRTASHFGDVADGRKAAGLPHSKGSEKARVGRPATIRKDTGIKPLLHKGLASVDR